MTDSKVMVIQRPDPRQCDEEMRGYLHTWCDAPRHRIPRVARYLTVIMPNELGDNEFVNHCKQCAKQICRDIHEPWPPPTATELHLMSGVLGSLEWILTNPNGFQQAVTDFSNDLTAGIRALLDVPAPSSDPQQPDTKHPDD